MGCVPKRADGDCVHLDPWTKRCNIWNERPQVCRGYDCNDDELLQVVLTRGFTTLTELVTARLPPRRRDKIAVPHLGDED